MSAAVEFKAVDILFARQPGRAGRAGMREALAALDAGATRGDIQSKFGVIVGVAGADLSVARGEISVLMGLSGSGKSTLLRAANGLNPVTRGHVLIQDGDSVCRLPTQYVLLGLTIGFNGFVPIEMIGTEIRDDGDLGIRLQEGQVV